MDLFRDRWLSLSHRAAMLEMLLLLCCAAHYQSVSWDDSKAIVSIGHVHFGPALYVLLRLAQATASSHS